MAFDLDGAVRQGRTGQVPPGWELFPLKAGQAIFGGIISLIMGLFFVVGGIYLFLSGTIITFKFLPDSLFDGGTGVVVGLIEALVVVLLGIMLGVAGVRSIARSRSTDYFLLLTPEGVAEARGKKAQGAAYVEVANLRAVTNGTELEVSLRGKPNITIGLSPYGKPQELYALILGGAQAAQQPGAQQPGA